LNHTEELTCPICDSIQDPLRLTFAVPVSLIRAFLKDKFRRQSKNGIGECPKCLGYFEKITGTSVVNCKTCSIAFCQDCFLPPHFPLSCGQMKFWQLKFEEQYKIVNLPKAAQYGLCTCGNYFPLSTIKESIYCFSSCRECPKSYRTDNDDRWIRQWEGRTIYLDIVKSPVLNYHIAKSVYESYLDIRNEIEDEKRISEMRKFGRNFLEDKQINDFVDLRFKALKLIEYSVVWLYFSRKNQGSDKNKEVSKILKKLRFLIDSIIGQITNKSGANVLEDIKSLQEYYSKAVMMF